MGNVAQLRSRPVRSGRRMSHGITGPYFVVDPDRRTGAAQGPCVGATSAGDGRSRRRGRTHRAGPSSGGRRTGLRVADRRGRLFPGACALATSRLNALSRLSRLSRLLAPLLVLAALAGCAGSDAEGPLDTSREPSEAPTPGRTAPTDDTNPSTERPPLTVSDRVPPIEELLDLGLDRTAATCFVATVDPDGDGRIGDPALFMEAFAACM